MRPRSLLVPLAMVLMLSAPAAAQTCLGLSSFAGSPVQVAGRGSLTSETSSVAAAVGYGLPRGIFGSAGFGTTSNDNFGGSSLEIGGTVGYQIALGSSSGVQLCPIASIGVGIGPRNTFHSGVDRSEKAASVGLAVAAPFAAGRRLKIVPTTSLSYAYRKDQAQNSAGVTLFQISERYAVGQFGVGLVLDSNISVRPGVEIPFSLDANDPSFGLAVSYNFGHTR